MPSIQITSPLPGDTVPTNVLVTGIFTMLNVVGSAPSPPAPPSPLPPSPLAQAPAPTTVAQSVSSLSVIITVKDSGGIQLANPVTLTVSGTSGNFAMTTPFTSHELLAGRIDCSIDAVLREGTTNRATDTVDSIDFAARGVAGGGTGLNNSPSYP